MWNSFKQPPRLEVTYKLFRTHLFRKCLVSFHDLHAPQTASKLTKVNTTDVRPIYFQGARALAKHCHRDGHVFWGAYDGSESVQELLFVLNYSLYSIWYLVLFQLPNYSIFPSFHGVTHNVATSLTQRLKTNAPAQSCARFQEIVFG